MYIKSNFAGDVEMILSQTIGCVSKFGDAKGIEMIAQAGLKLSALIGRKLIKKIESYK